VFGLLRDAYLAFMQDNAPRLAAALAYYAFSAIAPLLFLVTVVAGYFLGQNHVRTQLLQGLRTNLGDKIATFIAGLLPTLSGSNLTWASVIVAATVFLTATGLFVQLQGSLNTLWGSEHPAGKPPTLLQNIWLLVKTRLIAFALVLVFGALIIVFLVGNTILAAVATRIGSVIGFGAFFVRVGTFVLSTLLFTLVFAFIFRFLPSVKLQWREVWVGSAVTAALFTLGQVLIGLYFGRIAGTSPYGAAGALFLMLLWIYYSSMIVFFGAEVTWVFSQQYGTHAGGAGNLDKKNAVAEKGANIERETGRDASGSAAQATSQPPPEAITPVQRRGLARVLPGRTRAERPAPASSKPLHVGPPTLRDALGNAALAILAVPSVALLRLLWLLRGRR
jgi:membrane protein